MKRVIISTFVVIASLIHCGGIADLGSDSGAPTCPSDPKSACTSEGQKCEMEAPFCGGTVSETCTCTNAAWSCPVGFCPINYCKDGVAQGASCSISGAYCVQNVKPLCINSPLGCTCNGTEYECDTCSNDEDAGGVDANASD